jgi:hypothetical protein
VIVGCGLLLAACGGSSPSHSSNAATRGSSSKQAAATGPVAFAQCVRAHGVPSFPDPQNGHFLISSSVEQSPNFQSATQGCSHLLPGGLSNGGGASGSQTSSLLAFAHCMQTHGVPTFPDPAANGAIGIPAGVDPNSPQFTQAWSECNSKLPGSLKGSGQP